MKAAPRWTPLLLALAGCPHAPPEPPREIFGMDCALTSRSGPLTPEDAPLGFSALDVLAAMNGTVDLDARGDAPFPDARRAITFAFSEPAPAFVDDWDALPRNQDLCVVGPTLTFYAALEISGEDGWFTGQGTVLIRAQGTTPDRIWVEGHVDVEVDRGLDDLLRSKNAASYEPCPPRSITPYFASGPRASVPWSLRRGALEYHSCNRTSGMYDFVPLDAP